MPAVQVGEKAFVMYQQIRNTLRTPAFKNKSMLEALKDKELGRVIKDRVRSIGGMPREQLAGILHFALEKKDPYQLATSACFDPSQNISQEAEIKQFLDGLWQPYVGRSPEELAKDLVASSLSDCPLDESQKSFMTTAVPDSDTSPWTEISPPTSTLDRKGFPINPGEKISFKDGLTPVLQWTSTQTLELALWKQEFDKVADCDERASSKKIPEYNTWSECIKGLSKEEVQSLAGKLVFDWAYGMLVAEGQELKTSEHMFRGIVDRNGKLQGFTVVESRLNLNKFRKEHYAAISNKAKQIPSLYISFLVTAPSNLKDKGKARGNQQVKGVGSSLVALGVLESQRRKPWGGRLLLESMPSAASFYKKIGFWSLGTRTSMATDFYPLQLFWLEGEGGQKVMDRAGLKIETTP